MQDKQAIEKLVRPILDIRDEVSTNGEEAKLKAQFEKTKAVRRDRNLQIIKLSEECIAKTAKQPELEPEFDAAVHYLLDARLQLALQGDDASIEALFDAAKVFYERKPTSAAALEAQLTLVNLTHANAIRYGQAQPKWIQEFAKHAQLYAARFPDEQARSVKLLAQHFRIGLVTPPFVCSDHDHRWRGIQSLQVFEDRKPAEARHHHVGNDEIRFQGADLPLTFGPVRGQEYSIPVALQNPMQHRRDFAIIVDNQNRFFRGRVQFT